MKKPVARAVLVPAWWLVPESSVTKSVRTILKVFEAPGGQKIGVLPPTSEALGDNGYAEKRFTSGKPFARIE